ncbi:SAM-dependent methyltransferase [Streptomyces spectabilis]|uniref:SAM-dependent methyltransferase n=1 Tax=Streptomyces spectabilis TaxID=68270 RepID=A0A516RE95_STRST|nr:SAM-dependent methyltransferase [Streptomyces spectabilis]QDQ13984.1 SAM-dependent methyltransferase [Streptomyces spectabilis]
MTADSTGRIRTDIAHNARVWNYWLGGKDNYQVDRAVGEQVTEMFPGIGEVARADRAFLGRAVAHLVGDRGVRQLLDIGTGLPTGENTHEVAQRLAPDARIVYVDNDPIVLTHAHALLTSSPEGVTTYIDQDARNAREIVAAAAATLDLTRPVAVMLLGILNFIPDTDDTVRIVRTLMDEVASGSYLVLTHPTLDADVGGAGNQAAMDFWNENATPPITGRTRAEFQAYFEGLELLEPGVESCSRWRCPEAPVVPQFGAVARKP